MADKHSMNYDVRELKLGSSFTNNKTSQYHTIKYDFKPASVDVNKMATVDVGTNNQVTVTVPHLDGAGVPQTVFKGSQRPYTKECVLIIDRVTGEITLEKLSSNIQVKKTRQESVSKPRPLTPVAPELPTNTTQRSTSRTRVATTRRTNHQPPAPAPGPMPPAAAAGGAGARYGAQPHKPQHVVNMVRSPTRVKTSPPQAAPWSGGGNSTLASLPMIGLDDAPAPAPAAPPSYPQPSLSRPDRMPERMDRAPERMDRAPERMDRAPERMDRGPERMDRVSERMDRAPDRMDRAPERMDRAPERTDRGFMPDRHQLNSHPPAPAPVRHHSDSSSSSSSDSGSDSGSDSDSEDNTPTPNMHHGLTNGNTSNPALPSDVLNDDLCLSESGSDSD
ncbi:ell-associated factor Eaf [Pectinophora gossypiella]|nr:ell-associated factor Eaf [Pectinophora gossypiella]